MFKFIFGIIVGFMIFKFDWIDDMSNLINDYGVKEAIIEKLQEDVDINKLENGGEVSGIERGVVSSPYLRLYGTFL